MLRCYGNMRRLLFLLLFCWVGQAVLFAMEKTIGWFSPKKHSTPAEFAHFMVLHSLGHFLAGLVFFQCTSFASMCLQVRDSCTLASLWQQRPSSVDLLGLTIAGFAGVAVDLDHFIAAGFFSLAKARNLPGRPFGHFLTGLVIFIVFIVAVSALMTKLAARPFFLTICAFLIGWLSHLSRDAMHRGFWFWPPPSWTTWCSPGTWLRDPIRFYNTDALSTLEAYAPTMLFSMIIFHRVFQHSQSLHHVYAYSPLASDKALEPDL